MEKKDISAQDAARLKQAVINISRFPSNSRCADCHTQQSLWASVNLGVFLCSRCAGMHRNLGVHISQVRSINLDTWTPSQMLSVLVNGNLYVNCWLLYKTKDLRYGRQFLDDSIMSGFIRDKYEHYKYGDGRGLLLVDRETFKQLDVEKAMQIYNRALEVIRKQFEHTALRRNIIKAGGYTKGEDTLPNRNPMDREIFLVQGPTGTEFRTFQSPEEKKATHKEFHLPQREEHKAPKAQRNSYEISSPNRNHSSSIFDDPVASAPIPFDPFNLSSLNNPPRSNSNISFPSTTPSAFTHPKSDHTTVREEKLVDLDFD